MITSHNILIILVILIIVIYITNSQSSKKEPYTQTSYTQAECDILFPNSTSFTISPGVEHCITGAGPCMGSYDLNTKQCIF
jgi:hypothetical protein